MIILSMELQQAPGDVHGLLTHIAAPRGPTLQLYARDIDHAMLNLYFYNRKPNSETITITQ